MPCLGQLDFVAFRVDRIMYVIINNRKRNTHKQNIILPLHPLRFPVSAVPYPSP